MQNHQGLAACNNNNNSSNNNNNNHHSQVVRSLLDEQFSKILVDLDQKNNHHHHHDNKNDNTAASSSMSASSSGFSSASAVSNGGDNGGNISNNPPQPPPVPSRRRASLAGDNTYILDLSRPGEARSRNSLELVRSDPSNHHLPSCVRSLPSSKTSGSKHKSASFSSSATTTSKAEKSSSEKTGLCQGKCCRPLYIIPPTNPTIEEDEGAICKHRSSNHHKSRQHFDIINRIPTSASPRESGASSSGGDSSAEMVAGVAGRCPDCGRCKCARCVEQQPVTCCGGNMSDDCCVDVLTCMCCVKGIASFFASANPASHRAKRKGRHVLPAPTGSTNPNLDDSYLDSSDNEDEEGCFGLSSSNPCSCQGSSPRRTLRFACLTVLTLFLPCLACYLPCRAVGHGVRWCFNRSRAPNACRCPPRTSNLSPTHQPIRHQPRRYGGAGSLAATNNIRSKRSQTAPAHPFSSSSSSSPSKTKNHCSSSSKEKVPKRSSEFGLCSSSNSGIHESSISNINLNNNNLSEHVKRW